MTRMEQKAILDTFINSVREALQDKADQWPEDWDGHELRELAAYAFDSERTRLMREKSGQGRKRRLECRNAILVNNLY